MKFIKISIIVILFGFFAASCKQTAQKNITPDEFIQIQTEILTPGITEEAKASIIKKYGYTLKDYTDFEEKIEKDTELKKKVGEIRLNLQEKEAKK